MRKIVPPHRVENGSFGSRTLIAYRRNAYISNEDAYHFDGGGGSRIGSKGGRERPAANKKRFRFHSAPEPLNCRGIDTMPTSKTLLLAVIVCGLHFGCALQDIGRKIDNGCGYNEYEKRRTFEQKLEDQKLREENANKESNRKNNEEAVRRFNETVRLKAPNAADSSTDSINILNSGNVRNTPDPLQSPPAATTHTVTPRSDSSSTH